MRGCGPGDPATNAELAPEALLGRSSLWRRLLMIALIAAVAAPVAPPAQTAAWLVIYLAVTVAERSIVGRQGYIGRDRTGALITFALSGLHAWAAAVLIQLGDGGTRFFAVALVGFSSVNILLRFYSSPRLFLAAMAPHAAVLGWVSWGLFARYLADGAYLRALTPPAILIVYAALLLPARHRLAQAWGRLMEAKAVAEQASRAKSDFLATMSHEIRTPLNGVIGLAQAMQREPLAPAQKERLRLIRQSGETLLSLLNDALDFASIEAGHVSLEAGEFEVEQVVGAAEATFAPLAARKGLTFEVSVEAPARGVFRGDAVRIRQILYNLVSNAVKFTEAGGVRICVGHGAGTLNLVVADTGIGVDRSKVEDLFAPFVQADASATRRYGGAGLGLSICRALAERMGGRIAVAAAEGQGSVFTVTLPLERVAGPAFDDGAEARRAVEAPTNLRILAAEDNPVNQLVLKTVLAQAGLDPTVVENGAEALEAWRCGAWDLILMDIQMPVLDGVAATREIRAAEVAQARPRTPIIALTANAMSHQITEYEAAGMDLVVPKPLDAGSLFDAIERALEASPHRARAAAAA